MIAAAALGAACQVQGGPPLQVLSETSRLRWTDDLPATSPYFDGVTVRLAAARGETLGVEIARAADAPVPVALRIDAIAVQGFAVDHVAVTSPSTALYGGGRGPGRYPDRLRPIDGPVPTPRLAVFDVTVPTTTTPGLHRGELTVGDRRFPVELEVAPVTLPPLDAAPWVWAYYDPREVAAVAGTTGDAAATLEAERVTVARLLQVHGPAAQGSLLLLLVVPCLLPIPGTGTVLGLGVLHLAWAMWRGRGADVLPRRVAELEMSGTWARRVLHTLARVYALAARLARARQHWALAAPADRVVALAMMVMAIVLVLPIPFGNLMPALALLFLALGLAFRDGVSVLVGLAASVLTLVITAGVLGWALLWVAG